MADRHLEPDTPQLRARWGAFAWTAENAAKAKETVAHSIALFTQLPEESSTLVRCCC